MASNNGNPQEQKGAAAEAGQRGAAAGKAAQAAGSGPRRGAAATTEATDQEGRAASEAMPRSGEAGGEAARHSGQILSDTMRQGAHAVAAGQGRMITDMAGQAEETGRQMAQAIQGTAETMRTLMVLPGMTGRSLPDLQQAMGRFIDNIMNTNLRATQEAIRMVNPAVVIRLQQRFARDCLDTLMEGSTGLLHSARRAADETLRPMERQLEQLRQPAADQALADQAPNGRHGRVADVMTREVRLASPEDTVQQAARLMRQEDTGVLPVGENDRLVGMVTDRDLAMRLVAEGRDPAKTKVAEVMTHEVRYIFEDENLDRAADTMAEQQIHRLAVLNRDKRLVGIVSLSDLATGGHSPALAGRALGGIAREGGLHNQVAAG